MIQALSPNFNMRARNVPLDYVVLHYTGMKDADSALKRLRDPHSQVSAHYFIDEDGSLTHLVDETDRAWHAGKSFWRGQTDLNSASIGIELVNPGHEFGYRPFPAPQIATLKIVLTDIFSRHSMKRTTALLAHSDIAPTRKQDPGELFPWQQLAEAGFGLCPYPERHDFDRQSEAAINESKLSKPSLTDTELSDLLGYIGYDVSELSDALLAFQRRYHPENLTGKINGETTARLYALKRQIDV